MSEPLAPAVAPAAASAVAPAVGAAAHGLPLTIGVIGHRDLRSDEEPRIERQVRSIVESYRQRYPSVPILLITSLASGADTVAARACLDMDGVEILALLPFGSAEFEHDFDDPGELAEFRRLLTRVWRVATVDEVAPAEWLTPSSVPIDVTTPSGRDAAYQRCARFLALQSHVLLAIWDGRPPELIGGTADTLFDRIPRAEALPTPEDRADLWPPESGVQIHIPAGRRRHDDPVRTLTGELAVAEPMLLEDDHTWVPWNPQAADEVAEQLAEINANLNASGDPTPLTARVMHAADALAGQLQARFRRLAASVLIAGVVALVVVNAEQSLTQRWLFGSAVAVFALTGALWWGLARVRLKERFHRIRALAEGARVQSVWLSNELQACPSDFYLVSQPDVGWIRRALRTAWLVDRLDGFAGPEVVTASAWMHGQLDYFQGSGRRAGAIERNARKARTFRRVVAVGVILALVGLLPDATRFVSGVELPGWAALTGQTLWELGLGIAAAATAYAELMAFRQISRQYATSVEVFREGLRQLERASAGDAVRVRVITQQVGLEALRETSSWLALSYDRSIRPF